MRATEFVSEKWSEKYKRSIDCSHPRGFSQRAHCAGRKKNEDLNEFAVDKSGDGDDRSKLIGSIVRLLQAGNKIDFFVPGIRGHVVGQTGGNSLILKRWKKPYSKVSYSLPLSAEDDDRFVLKMINPDYYQVVEKEHFNEAATRYQVVCDGTRKGIFADRDRAIANAKSMFRHEKEYYHIAVVDLNTGNEVWSWSAPERDAENQLDELSFKGSPCTKDCSGHRAGYAWSQRKGGRDAASWSQSFNNGAWLHNNGY